MFPATCQSRRPSSAPARKTQRRPGIRSARGACARTGARRCLGRAGAASVSDSDEPTANVTASAPKMSASDHASVAETLADPERPRDERARQQQHERSRTRAGRASSVEQLRDASRSRASRPSRGTCGRGRRGRAARAGRWRRAAASARARRTASPWCLARKRRWPRTFSRNMRPPCEAPPTCTHSAPGKKTHLPARLAEAVGPVRLLAEEEERLVERADLLDRLAPDEHAGAHQELRLAHLLWSKPPA